MGLLVLIGAVALRYASTLAAELFTMRFSMLLGIAGFVVFLAGKTQLRHWWLPALLLLLSVPIPAVVLNSVAFPLQLKASEIGAALLDSRHVPVTIAGNVIQLPGQSLFVTEACSGLRSLTALLSLGVLTGGLWLHTAWFRLFLAAAAIPIAIALNSIRVFLSGFLAYYAAPSWSEGFMHYTEGWGIFMVAFGILGMCAWVIAGWEHRRKRGGKA